MQKKEKPCRHEYVKIFQRKYKGLGRRLVSTKGYLPVGFTIKDFSHLKEGSYCFCTNCRLRMFPVRIDVAKLNRILAQKNNSLPLPIAEILGESNQEEDIWVEESTSEANDGNSELQEVNVDELQIESIEVSDIADKKVIVSGEIDPEEEGEN